MGQILEEYGKWKKRITTAYLEVFIFQLLHQREHYAGELVTICQNELDNEVKVPTVYAILNRCNQSDLIKIDTIQSESGVSRGTERKYYTLTSNGEAYYQQLVEAIDRLNALVNEKYTDGGNNNE